MDELIAEAAAKIQDIADLSTDSRLSYHSDSTAAAAVVLCQTLFACTGLLLRAMQQIERGSDDRTDKDAE